MLDQVIAGSVTGGPGGGIGRPLASRALELLEPGPAGRADGAFEQDRSGVGARAALRGRDFVKAPHGFRRQC